MTEALSRGITARLAFAISCLLCAFICLPSVLLRGRPPRRKRRNQAQVTLEMEQLRRALTEARHVAISRPRPAWQASSTSILKRWWTPSLSRKACVQACSVDTEYLSLSLLLSWGMAVCTPPPAPPPPACRMRSCDFGERFGETASLYFLLLPSCLCPFVCGRETL